MDSFGRVYVLVHNVPKNIRSKHMRNFFSEAIEKGLVRCFHYRHRKCSTLESLRIELNKDTYACFVKLRNFKALKRFLALYDNKAWVDGKNSCCQVHQLIVDESSPGKCYNENKESAVERINIDNLNLVQMKQILEMRPPKILPRGNVGTPVRYILKSIRKCEMPASVLVKLGISLQDICYRRKYVSISWDYNKRNGFFSNHKHLKRHETSCDNSQPVDDDEPEEWDRHEASCEDPFKVVPKERLYEQNMDVVWEKGGPGIVWYTDAVFWDATEENDEKDTDDWDVDHEEIDKELNLQLLNPNVPRGNYSLPPKYEKQSKADSNAFKELSEVVRGQIDKKANFQPIKSTVPQEYSLPQKKKKLSKADLNGFKELTDGFGGKIMKKYGWKKGHGLGARNQGLTEAIPNDGQSSNDKTGLGYRGSKLFNFGLTDEKN